MPAEGRAGRANWSRRERYRVAGERSGADGTEALATSFGACPVRADAAAGAAVPPASSEPLVRRGSERSQRRTSSGTSGRPARPQPSSACQHQARRELVSELGAHAAELVQQAGADQDRPAATAAVTAATAGTPLQIMCRRRSPGPAAVTEKTPKTGYYYGGYVRSNRDERR
jgi:hypothetical protein